MDIDKIKGFKNFFGPTKEDADADTSTYEQYYKTSREEYHVQNGLAGSKMILHEPRSYSESQQIADFLKERNSVVVNLKRVTPDQGKRIMDFLSGTIYAINGSVQKLGGGIFLCTPNNVNVEGEITDDAAPSKGRGQKKNDEEEEDSFF